jgi:PD-(D/E)XK nuclease superfamily
MAENGLIDLISELARDVFRTLGSGHSEAVYQKAMEVGLRLRHVKFEAQKVIELTYRDHYIGTENLDLLVEADSRPGGLGTPLRQKVIVELKTLQAVKLGLPEEQQLRNYMKNLGIERGVLINFPQPGRTKKEIEAGLASFNALDPEIRIVTPTESIPPAPE